MSTIGSAILRAFGLKRINNNQSLMFPDLDEAFLSLAKTCAPYTMTSTERLYAVYQSVDYILKNNIPGDFVECGVWKGGCAMMMAHALKKYNCYDRKIYLYDTFEGMTEPGEKDISYAKHPAHKKYNESLHQESGTNWCRSELDEVLHNLQRTGYPIENFICVKGKVEDTIPGDMPEKIALLRLDTDWYESTLHELQYLYPRLSEKGVLIIDDYGHWLGCREAVDEYFKANDIKMLLTRTDYTGRLGIKI